MLSDAKGSERYTRSEMEFYDYPGKYKEKSDGERYAKIQLQSEQAMDHRRHGNGEAVSLFPGGLDQAGEASQGLRKTSNIWWSEPPIRLPRSRIVWQHGGQRRVKARLFRKLRIPAERPAVPRADRDAEAADPRHSDRQGRDQGRRIRARRSTSKTSARSMCGSTGTERRSGRAGCASRRFGPASDGAVSSFRASVRKR